MFKLSSEAWPVPYAVRVGLRVICFCGCAMIASALWLHATIVVAILIIVFFFAILCVSTPFRRFGSKYFSEDAVHFDKNLVEMDIAGVEYWKDNLILKDYEGSLDLVKFNSFEVYTRNVIIGEFVQRLAICIKVEFDGTDPEKTLNLYRSMRVVDSKASTEWKDWLRDRLPSKVRNVVTALAIQGRLSRFFHEDMDGEFLDLIQSAMKPELDLFGGGFIVKASYELLEQNEEAGEYDLSEAADRAFASQVERIRGTLPCVPEN